MAYLYRHIRLDNNTPFYIGIGSSVDYSRAYERFARNTLWKNIINKTEYRIEIVLDELSWDEACIKEREFIALYGRRDLGKGPLVNLTDGGDGIFGFKHSEETKTKLRKPKSRESELKRQETYKQLNYSHSKDTKQKISTALIGIKRSKESQEKRIATRKQNGVVPWNKGKKTASTRTEYLHSEETKKNMRKPKTKIQCPHCGINGTVKKMTEKHFDNCKSLG